MLNNHFNMSNDIPNVFLLVMVENYLGNQQEIPQLALYQSQEICDLLRNSPQKRHLIASPCISSAQKGHFFILISQ